MNDKQVILEAQYARLEKDKQEINSGISSMENQIAEINKQIERNRGALSYAHILAESIKVELATMQAQAIAAVLEMQKPA